MAKRVGRNDPCPCGSGRKYKRCCETAVRRRDRFIIMALLAAVLGALLIGLLSFETDRGQPGPRRVWSPEHGHYHDVP